MTIAINNFSGTFPSFEIQSYESPGPRLYVYHAQPKDVKAISSTLKAWKEILMDRFGNTRAKHQKENTPETSVDFFRNSAVTKI